MFPPPTITSRSAMLRKLQAALTALRTGAEVSDIVEWFDDPVLGP